MNDLLARLSKEHQAATRTRAMETPNQAQTTAPGYDLFSGRNQPARPTNERESRRSEDEQDLAEEEISFQELDAEDVDFESYPPQPSPAGLPLPASAQPYSAARFRLRSRDVYDGNN